jgi:hypothetical protein
LWLIFQGERKASLDWQAVSATAFYLFTLAGLLINEIFLHYFHLKALATVSAVI